MHHRAAEPLDLPLPDSFGGLDQHQEQQYQTLVELLDFANESLLPSWQFRARQFESLLGGWNWDRTIPKSICEQAGIDDPDKIDQIIDGFMGTDFGLYLAQLNALEVRPEILFSDWHEALNRDSPTIVTASEIEPTFANGSFMLGVEMMTHGLVEIIRVSAAEAAVGIELEVFIGEKEGEEVLDWDPTDRQGDVRGALNVYNRLASSKQRPIDPERLVGVSKSVMTSLGMLSVK